MLKITKNTLWTVMVLGLMGCGTMGAMNKKPEQQKPVETDTPKSFFRDVLSLYVNHALEPEILKNKIPKSLEEQFARDLVLYEKNQVTKFIEGQAIEKLWQDRCSFITTKINQMYMFYEKDKKNNDEELKQIALIGLECLNTIEKKITSTSEKYNYTKRMNSGLWWYQRRPTIYACITGIIGGFLQSFLEQRVKNDPIVPFIGTAFSTLSTGLFCNQSWQRNKKSPAEAASLTGAATWGGHLLGYLATKKVGDVVKNWHKKPAYQTISGN